MLRLLLGLMLVGMFSGCRGETGPPAPPPPVKVTTAKPLVMPIVEWDEYIGRLDPIDAVEVRARVGGFLQSTHFYEGQLVEKDDLLAIIDPRPFEAELNAASARLQEAKAKLSESEAILKQANAQHASALAQLTLADQRLERARKLAKTNTIAQDDVDGRESEQMQASAAYEATNAMIDSAKAGMATAKAAIETARANVEAADLNVRYTRVRAPISGRISRRYVTEGNLISGGGEQSTLLTTIVSINPIHCYFDADEQAFLKYARLAREGKRESSRDVKNPVYMRLIDEEGFPHLGHMDFVDNRIDPNTGTMRARAIFPNDDNTLTAGLFAEVRLPGSGRYDAVLIPDSAISSDQSERFVFLVGNDNKITRRPVELGPMSKGLRIIRTGLEGSERIVTHGLQRVFVGAEVAATDEAIIPGEGQGLPDSYQPVSPDKWLSRRPTDPPEGVSAKGPEVSHDPAGDLDDNTNEPILEGNES